MQATDPPIPKSKCSQQQINLPLAASALCCHAKLLIQTVVQNRGCCKIDEQSSMEQQLLFVPKMKKQAPKNLLFMV